MKEEIGKEYERLKKKYKQSDPIRYQKEKNKLVTSQKKIIRSEIINLTIQVLVALTLFRVFNTGLAGADMHLLYDFVPRPELPFNLTFLGSIDLTHPSLQLNILSSVLLFVVEGLGILFNPWEPTRNETLMLVMVPIAVFFYLYSMPAGKKLFIITTLSVSVILMFVMEGIDLLKVSRRKELF